MHPGLRHQLLAFTLPALLFACGADPQPCTRCPNVAGRYSTVRTIGRIESCPQPPIGGTVPIVVVQNGSNLRFDYEGDELRGTLFEDHSAQASSLEKPDARNRYRIARELEATFVEEAGTMRLQATLRERRTPIGLASNGGQACEFTATLQGSR